MSGRFENFVAQLRGALAAVFGRLCAGLYRGASTSLTVAHNWRWRLAAVALLAALAYGLYAHPPLATAHRGEIVVRTNALNGSVIAYTAGTALVLPGIHDIRRYPSRDQVYRPVEGARADGPAPFQSNEGLSIGVELTVRWAIDRSRIVQMSKEYPDDLDADLVRPAVQGIVYPLFARHSVRDIFSGRRTEIQQEITAALRPKLAAAGLLLRGVDMGTVDLPPDYRAGMEALLSEELQTEKVRYTLELKEAQLKQAQMEAEAEKMRRQTAAEAAGEEEVIAARAREETMKHVLPFKRKQIEQRQLEAQAEKVARIRGAEGAAEARRIEARGEADSRRTLADSEAYRLEVVGKAAAAQMEREGTLIARYPLLIQKTLADKLSDKVQVIIAPTPEAGRFIGSNLIGVQDSRSAVEATSTMGSGTQRPR